MQHNKGRGYDWKGKPWPVVIMAGGKGERLGALTRDIPKPMLPIADKPILQHLLESLAACGFEEFFLSVKYKSEIIRQHFGDGSDWGVDIRYIEEPGAYLGTAGPLQLLPETEGGPMLLINGDLLTSLHFDALLDFHLESGCEATVCVREYPIRLPFGVVNTSEGRLKRIEEKPVHKSFVNAGIYILEQKLLKTLRPGQAIDTTDLLQMLLLTGTEIASYVINEFWMDIGNAEDYQLAQESYAHLQDIHPQNDET